jgi:hypothetical protein
MTDPDAGPMPDDRTSAKEDAACMTTTRSIRPRRPTAEERRLFDAFCFMRALYAERGPQDAVPVATITSVMAAANGRLGAISVP